MKTKEEFAVVKFKVEGEEGEALQGLVVDILGVEGGNYRVRDMASGEVGIVPKEVLLTEEIIEKANRLGGLYETATSGLPMSSMEAMGQAARNRRTREEARELFDRLYDEYVKENS